MNERSLAEQILFHHLLEEDFEQDKKKKFRLGSEPDPSLTKKQHSTWNKTIFSVTSVNRGSSDVQVQEK